MKVYYILFLLFCVILSCKNSTKKNLLKEVDNMIQTVDSIRVVFENNRNDSLMVYIQQVMDVEFRIRRFYESDTIDVALTKKMNQYKMVRKKLKPIVKNNFKIDRGTIEELETLRRLKTDIENGAGDRSKYPSYINFEKSKIKQLKVVLDEILSVQKDQISTFNNLHDELYRFSLQLEQKKS